jgi:Ferritin-like domain
MGSDPNRRELLRRGITAGAVGVAGSALQSPARALGAASASSSDAAEVGRLLRFELLVGFVYRHVLASSILPGDARKVIETLGAQERAHVSALSVALDRLGGKPPPGPANIAAADKDLAGRRVSGRLGQLRGARDALRLLLALEHVAEGAYYVSMAKLSDPKLLRLSAEIMGSEAQHVTVIFVLLHPGELTQAVPYAFVQGRR